MKANRLLRLRLIDIEAVLNIPECGSLYKTAEEYSVSPPTMSRTLARAEDALGVKLVLLDGGSASNPRLTKEGLELKSRLQAAIDFLNGDFDEDVVSLQNRAERAEAKLKQVSHMAQQYADSVANIATNE